MDGKWASPPGPLGRGATYALAELLGGDAARARRLLRISGSTVGLIRASQSGQLDLSRQERKRLAAAVDFGLSWLRSPAPKVLTCPSAVARMATALVPLPVESLRVYVLDRGKRVLGQSSIGGGVDRVSATPADVMRAVFRLGGVGFVLVHNHPSGDPRPSEADRRFTAQVRAAAEVCGLELIDHLIVARGGWRSLRAEVDEWT